MAQHTTTAAAAATVAAYWGNPVRSRTPNGPLAALPTAAAPRGMRTGMLPTGTVAYGKRTLATRTVGPRAAAATTAGTLPVVGTAATRRARIARAPQPLATGTPVVAYGHVGTVVCATAVRRGNPAVAVRVPGVGTLYALPATVVHGAQYNPLGNVGGHAGSVVANGRAAATPGAPLPANGVHYGHTATYGHALY